MKDTKVIMVSIGIAILSVLLVKYTTEKVKETETNDIELENLDFLNNFEPFENYEIVNTNNIQRVQPSSNFGSSSPRQSIMSRFIRSK